MTAWPSLVQMDYLGPLLIFQSINRGKYLDSGENIQFVLKNLGHLDQETGVGHLSTRPKLLVKVPKFAKLLPKPLKIHAKVQKDVQ